MKPLVNWTQNLVVSLYFSHRNVVYIVFDKNTKTEYYELMPLIGGHTCMYQLYHSLFHAC